MTILDSLEVSAVAATRVYFMAGLDIELRSSMGLEGYFIACLQDVDIKNTGLKRSILFPFPAFLLDLLVSLFDQCVP